MVTADTNQSQGLAEQSRDGLAFKRWDNEIECAVILRGLKCFRIIGGPNEHHASGNGGAIREIDEVSPRTVSKLGIGKYQVRVGLFNKENGIRLSPDTEGINTQAPEHKFERLARLRAVVNHESERFSFHGIHPRYRNHNPLTEAEAGVGHVCGFSACPTRSPLPLLLAYSGSLLL